MSYIIKKEKHLDLFVALKSAYTDLKISMDCIPVKSRHQAGKKELIQDLKAVTRTVGEDYQIRIKVNTLEGVLKEIKRLK